MQLCFLLALIVTVVSIFIYLNIKNNIKLKILSTIIGGIVSLAILVFPLLNEENIILNGINSFFYSLQSIGINQDLSIISSINLNSVLGISYIVYIYLIFLALPLLTASVILIFLSDIFVKLKFELNKNKKLYIFSEVNEKSIFVAKDILIKEKNQGIFIFANYNRENNIYDLNDIKCIKLSQDIKNLKLSNKNNKVTYYLISKDEEENLNNSLALIDKYKNRKNTKIYIVNNSKDAPIILDSTNKGEIELEIVNEVERVIYNLLDKYPLYLNAINNKISILIIGCGNTGKEFLKSVIWCGQVMGYKLQITVVDIKADIIKEELEIDMPEIFKNYDITFINANIKSKETISKIKRILDINYIFVSMENDNKNIDSAIMLRRLFLKWDKSNYNRKPIINIWIENEYKKEQISSLVNERASSYDLNAFGSIKDMYLDNCIIDFKIEQLAKQVHLSYDKKDVDFHKYNLLEYNKRSSRATALHLKYKLYSVLREEYTGNIKKDLESYNKYLTVELEELLSINEHDRWSAYMRTIGYTLATVDDVKKYIVKTSDYRHHLCKMHPALVSFNELKQVDDCLNSFTSQNISLEESDRKIIRNMPEILAKYINKE